MVVICVIQIVALQIQKLYIIFVEETKNHYPTTVISLVCYAYVWNDFKEGIPNFKFIAKQLNQNVFDFYALSIDNDNEAARKYTHQPYQQLKYKQYDSQNESIDGAVLYNSLGTNILNEWLIEKL